VSDIQRTVGAGALLAGETIIDCHGHMGPWCRFHIPGDPSDAGMVAAMDRCGIERVIASPHIAIGPDAPAGNEMVAAAVRRFPHRISGYCTVNPNYPVEETVGELEKHIAHGNLVGIKVHPAVHEHPIGGPGYRAMWEWAQAHSVPVLVHTWEGDPRCAPALFPALSRDFPNVPILLGHCGGSAGAMLESAELARAHEQLYLDLTTSRLPFGILEMLVARIGADRILFGTDMPFIDPRPKLGYVAFARISDDDKRKILGLNTRRLFRL
jgi:predicted TIM-barrel fold metal-dependent hydrolase